MRKRGNAEFSKNINKTGESNLLESNISLKLNNYNDIFSSFDPRPYSEKALSVDFLDETKRASIDKGENKIELRLLIPLNLRKIETERIIKRKLKEHFERHSKQIKKEYKKIIKNGIIFAIVGVILMFIATLVFFKSSKETITAHFLLILLEPAGWFFFWEGLWQIIFEPKHKKPELEFYKKMSNCTIIFSSY